MTAKKATARASSRSSASNSQATPAALRKLEENVQSLKDSIVNHLHITLARDTASATKRDWWMATSHAVHDRILARFIRTMETHHRENVRRVYYLSLEYLMGRMLNNNIWNAGLRDQTEQALAE